jgi:Zn-dependent M28 family amino/carboxypeptidase
MKNSSRIFIFVCLLLSLLSSACEAVEPASPSFDADLAYQHLEKQVSFGYRYPGSDGHAQTIDWITDELKSQAWQVTFYEYPYFDQIITNIIAHRDGTKPHILLGAHYDTRAKADQDKTNTDEPVLGANDGASGVAVLLELARVLPESIPNEITLAFFDFEDQGNIAQYQWIAGSTALVNDPAFPLPDQAIILDMIGDKDLNIYTDRNSDEVLSAEIFQAAAALNYDRIFIPELKYNMLDDHVPFKNKGIPAVDIIDFDYPYWHTRDDVALNTSPESLGIIGETLLYWLSKNNGS